jgi:hypothetical protein
MTWAFLTSILLMGASQAWADLSDSGNLVIGGTATIQGNSFSVGGTTFSIVGGTITVGGFVRLSNQGLMFGDGTTQTTAGGSSQAIFARVYNNANETISNASVTNLTFNTERWDTNGMHSTSSNTDRLTATVAGVYSICISIRWASDSTSGIRLLRILYNGSTNIAEDRRSATSGDNTLLGLCTQYYLAASDYVVAAAYQTSGGNLNVQAEGNESPEFSMAYMGGL